METVIWNLHSVIYNTLEFDCYNKGKKERKWKNPIKKEN